MAARARNGLPQEQVSLSSLGAELDLANLETRRVVDDPAAVRISSQFRFRGNSGATPAPTVRL
jgi:hypothetical protein